MTLEEATPLITASATLIEQLVMGIINSVHMTSDEKDSALTLLSDSLDATATKVENVRIEKPSGN